MSPLRRPFSRKKPKDKDLPPPPSLINLEENPFEAPPDSSPPPLSPSNREKYPFTGPPKTFPSPSGREESPFTGSPQSSPPSSRHEESPFTGPPKITPSTPPISGREESPFEGPPRPTPPVPDREESPFARSPELPSPPAFPQNIPTRPPFPEPPPLPQVRTEIQEHSPVQNDLTTSLLDELRQTGFGSYLQDTPDEKAPMRTIDDVTRNHYFATKEDYLAAANKHLDMEFYENAAVNFSCAILCVFLGEDVFKASHLISELASGMHLSVINSQFFQGTRVLLKANLIRSPPFLYQAEKWLLVNIDNLYQEDKDLILRAIQVSKENLGLS
ncbi:MAG: hypothetical protein ACFFC7_25420 [Candidatus Hermodarchaeota archaeon]